MEKKKERKKDRGAAQALESTQRWLRVSQGAKRVRGGGGGGGEKKNGRVFERLSAVLGPLLVRIPRRVVAGQLPETRPPVAEVGEILLRGGGQRVDGAERQRWGAGTLEGVRLEGVVRWHRQVGVGLLHLLPDVAFEQGEVRGGRRQPLCTDAAAAAANAIHPTDLHPLRQRAHVGARVAALGLWEVVEVPQGAHVVGLSVLLAAALVVVLDDVVPHVLLVLGHPLALAVAFEGQNQQDQD